MDRDEEEAQHIRRERYTHEEYGEGQTLVLEGVINRAQQQVERPQELESELQDEIGQNHHRPDDEEPEVKDSAAKKTIPSESSCARNA